MLGFIKVIKLVGFKYSAMAGERISSTRYGYSVHKQKVDYYEYSLRVVKVFL